ncbi:MAG: PilZ domain-containing protein [Planctomycetota bacterium]|nr:PilZ domain-containing protein [Planctomycetota bacterium]
MDEQNRRQAVRVACDLPIRLSDGEAERHGRIVDISRTGLRVRIPGAALGVHRLSSLVQVTRNLQEALGDTFLGELHYEMLGPLVQRQLTPCRIAKRDWEQTDVEVGCQFESPLRDEEVGMLGVALPAVGAEDAPEDVEGSGPFRRTEPAPTRPHLRKAPKPQLTAYLYPAPGKTSKPLVTRTHALTKGMAILEVASGQGWDLPDLAVADLVMALDAAYGTSILLRVVDGDDDLWAGPAEIQEVDIRPGNNEIRLGVTFSQQLRTEELGRLGLPTPA